MSKSAAIENHVHFGVPIFRKRFPKFFEHQEKVIEYIRVLRERDGGIVKSNVHGWHSSEHLHLAEDGDVKWLIRRLLSVITRCINEYEGDSVKQVSMVAAWGNMVQGGAWHAPHVHLPAQWSGAFYVSSGDLKDAPNGSRDGHIMFFDPLPMGKRFRRSNTVTYTPEEGVMLLFPGYLQHMVAPYYGESPRISISFNVTVDYKQQDGANEPPDGDR